MPDIKDQKLLYHLTSFENLAGILAGGLKPRASLQKFSDVADPEILVKRKMLGLDHFVPSIGFATTRSMGGKTQAPAHTIFTDYRATLGCTKQRLASHSEAPIGKRCFSAARLPDRI